MKDDLMQYELSYSWVASILRHPVFEGDTQSILVEEASLLAESVRSSLSAIYV